MPGSGKSTLGSAAAKKLGLRFSDLDEEIEIASGSSISRIFEEKGEDFFRDAETRATRDALAREPEILAVGSGWIASAANRALLHSQVRIIYLRASVPVLLSRLGDAKSRPLLAGGETERKLKRLESARSALYETADATLDTDGLTEVQAIDRLITLIQHLNEK